MILMVKFCINDPFPLLCGTALSLKAEQSHSEQVDLWLGYRIAELERSIASQGIHLPRRKNKSTQTLWLGLDPKMLQTPYTEIRRVLEDLNPRPGQRVVDLGCAYGRMGWVLHRHWPGVEFIGTEIVGERVREAHRVYGWRGLKSTSIVHMDLADPEVPIPEGDIYFLYDFGSDWAIESVLFRLQQMSRNRQIKLVARGRRSPEMISNRHFSWLLPVPTGAAASTVMFSSLEASRLASAL